MTNLTTTKRLLVRIDDKREGRSTSDFLLPISVAGKIVLLGVQSGKQLDKGLVVYVGRDVSVSDLFAKLVDTGRKIANVEETVALISAYTSQLAAFKIGQTVTLVADEESDSGFSLQAVAQARTRPRKSKLP